MKYYTLSEASKITGIPYTTLKHWIRTKQIIVEQDKNNGYHMFSEWNIWMLFDMMRSRQAGLPINYVYEDLDCNDWKKLHNDSLQKLYNTRHHIDEQIKELNCFLERLDELPELMENPIRKGSPPDFDRLAKRDLTDPSLQKLFREKIMSIATYCTIGENFSLNKIDAIAMPPDIDSGKTLWKRNENELFFVALIKRNTKDNTDNTLEILQGLKKEGYNPKYMIVYSLANDTKNNICYFKAYIHPEEVE